MSAIRTGKFTSANCDGGTPSSLKLLSRLSRVSGAEDDMSSEGISTLRVLPSFCMRYEEEPPSTTVRRGLLEVADSSSACLGAILDNAFARVRSNAAITHH